MFALWRSLPTRSSLHRVLPLALLPSAVLLLPACRDLFLPTPPAPAGLALSIGAATLDGSDPAYQQVDQLHIRLIRPGVPELVRDLAFPPPGNEVRLTVELTQPQETAQLFIELRRGTNALYRDSTSVVLRARETTEAPLTLHAVPARVGVGSPVPEMQSLGDTLQLRGAALFATGDTISGLTLGWQVLDPGVVEVDAGGAVISRAEGQARVEVRYRDLADTVLVQVRAVIALVEVNPDTAVLQVGETLPLSAVLRDARGNELSASDSEGNVISGRAVSWSSSRPAVAQVDEHSGLVTAVAPDTVTITATASSGRSGSASVNISPLAPTVSECGVSQVTTTQATLTCTVDPRQALSQVRFELGGDQSLEPHSSTAPRAVSGGPQQVSEVISGMSPNTLVFWRGVASNAGGETAGEVQSFTTQPLPPFTLTIVGGGTGSGTVSGPHGLECTIIQGVASGTCELSFTSGRPEIVTLTATPAPGHSFVEWNACNGPSPCTVFLTETVIGTVTFAPPSFTISIAPEGSGSGRVDGPIGIDCVVTDGQTSGSCQATYPSGTHIMLTATPASGHSFTGWTGDCASTDPQCPLLVESDIDLTVGFTPVTLALLITGGGTTGDGLVTGPNGISCTITEGTAAGVCQADFVMGSLVTLSASATRGVFAGWGEACSGMDATCAVTISEPREVTASFSSPFSELTNARNYTCALTTTGRPYCWGASETFASLTPEAVPTTLAFTTISAGTHHICGLTDTGRAYCWGFDGGGQLGTGDTDHTGNVPVPIDSDDSFISISANLSHTCAITTAGDAYCWGFNQSGQLGTGDFDDSNHPVPVNTALTFTQVTTGSTHTCALGTDERAYCWGGGTQGQLGTGDSSPGITPTPVALGLSFAALTANSSSTCGLTLTGAAYCWGSNFNGELGTGDQTPREVPAAVEGMLTFSALSAGGGHTCGLTDSGEAYCWGWGGLGQLGTGDQATRFSPAAVDTPLRFSGLTAGGNHTCGVTSTGQVYCWGENSEGELGTGDTDHRSLPAAVKQ